MALVCFSETNRQLLAIDEVEKALTDNLNNYDEAIASVLQLVAEKVEKSLMERPVHHHAKLSDFRTPESSHPFIINGIPCFLTVRCVAVAHPAQDDGSSVDGFDAPKPSAPPKILILRRSPNDSGGDMCDVPGGGVDDEGENGKEFVLDESLFAALFREVDQETGQKLECVDHALTTRAWCKFKNQELQVYVAFCYIVERPMDQWKEIILSDEHSDSKWITEADMEDYEFHGQNGKILHEAFKAMKA